MSGFFAQGRRFDLTSMRSIPDLLDLYKQGKLALPNFQREWTWTAPKVHNLIDSMIRNYPIGSIITIKANKEARKNFGAKCFEVGIPEPKFEENDEVELVLDGQQRLTSILQILSSDGVELKKEKGPGREKVWYYVDLKALLKAREDGKSERDIGDIVLNFKELENKGRIIYDPDKYDDNFRSEKVEIPIPEKHNKEFKEFEELVIPVRTLLCEKSKDKWGENYWGYNYKGHKSHQFSSQDMRNLEKVIDGLHGRLCNYEIAKVVLASKTELFQVCGIFENMNTNMVILTVFDLLTAKYAKDKYNLHEEWEKIVKNNRINALGGDSEQEDSDGDNRQTTPQNRMVAAFYDKKNAQEEKIDFARMVTMCHKKAGGEGALKEDQEILNLPSKGFDHWKEAVQEGIRHACKFLHDMGIPENRKVVRTQFTVLSAIFSYLTHEKEGENEEARKKLKQWFWRSLLFKRYGDRALGSAGKDFHDVCNWIINDEGDPLSDWISNKGGLENIRSNSMKNRILLLLLCNGGGWGRFSDDKYKGEKFEQHHIFPKAWCEARENLDKKDWDSVINLIEIPKSLNLKNSDAEAKGLGDILEKAIGEEQTKKVFEKNLIDREHLADNDFDKFIGDREEKLTQLVEAAIGIKRNTPRSPTPSA